MADIFNFAIIEQNKIMRMSPATLEIGSQFDNRAQTLFFSRPEGFEGHNLILKFAVGNKSFDPVHLGMENEFTLTNLFTQATKLDMQAMLVLGGEKESTNIVSLTFRKSLNPGLPLEYPAGQMLDLMQTAFTDAEQDETTVTFKNLAGEKVGSIEIGSNGGGSSVPGDRTPMFTQPEIVDAPLSQIFEGGIGATRTTVLGIGGTITFPQDSNADFYDISTASHWFRRNDVMVCVYKGDDEWVGELTPDNTFVYPVSGLCAFTYRCPHFGDISGVTFSQPAISRTLHDVVMATIQDDSLHKQEQIDDLRLREAQDVVGAHMISPQFPVTKTADGTLVLTEVDVSIPHVDPNDRGEYQASAELPATQNLNGYAGVANSDYPSGYELYKPVLIGGDQVINAMPQMIADPVTAGNTFNEIRIPYTFNLQNLTDLPDIFTTGRRPLYIPLRPASLTVPNNHEAFISFNCALYKYPGLFLSIPYASLEITDMDGAPSFPREVLSYAMYNEWADDDDGYPEGSHMIFDGTGEDYAKIYCETASGERITLRIAFSTGEGPESAVQSAQLLQSRGMQFMKLSGEVYVWTAQGEEYVSGTTITGEDRPGILRPSQYKDILNRLAALEAR